ncbi:MAG: family 20 glycosylhydrolase [Chloroflexi bacterium]|nr:family 20 glycosylhydrolase [Chloroflexota bacterium]
MAKNLILLPNPQKLTFNVGRVTLAGQQTIALDSADARLRQAAARLQRALARYAAVNWNVVAGDTATDEGLTILINNKVDKPQGYRLTIAPGGITLQAHDEAGAFYGIITLIQVLQQFGADLPVLVIEDWPNFPNRGVMLDISRDKVPTMDTLYDLVDRLASWKVNQLQLYTEHTFAYRQHPDVWAKASPITADEIRALDAYCRERFIELVPNQNSFGHMHRWFEHLQYMPLAETETGFTDPWGNWHDYPFSLTPTNPDTIPFLDGLYDELLPNFSSRQFNVGCDETFDLGQGRSRALVEEKGEGRVYLDFLLKIYELVKKRGLTMQFWGDIILHHPELVPELPKDVIALNWGYESWHDFENECRVFAESGIPFYVCPGTSSWTTIAGRTDNAMGNIRNAVENGLKYGAIGVLNTDWGDWGHWQPYPVSFLGFAYGAALSWSYQQNVEMDICAALNTFAFEDKAGVMGKLAYDLGNTYQQPGVTVVNGSALFWAYHLPLDILTQTDVTGRFAYHRANLIGAVNLPDHLRHTLAYIDRVMEPLEQAQMARPDAALMKDEFRLAADLLRHGAKRLLLIVGDTSISKAHLCAELEELQIRYRTIWLARNRPGGLAESIGRMEAACAAYR